MRRICTASNCRLMSCWKQVKISPMSQVADLVEAPVVVPAAAQDSAVRAPRRPGVGQPDVRGQRDHVAGRVVRVVGRPRGCVASSGAAGSRRAADHQLLLEDVNPVPELHQHPDQPHHEVGAARRPGGLARGARPQPDQRVHLRADAGDGLAMPSMNPMRFRGTVPAGPGGADEPVDPPVPACRRGCSWRCRAARAAPCPRTRRSAGGPGRRRTAPGQGRRWGTAVIAVSLAGSRAASPNRSSNSVDPTPNVTVSPSGTTSGRARRNPTADRRCRQAAASRPR